MGTSSDLDLDLARAAAHLAQAGDFAGARERLAGASLAAAALLEAMAWTATSPGEPPASPARLRAQPAGDAEGAILTLLCVEGERWSLLAFDWTALAEWIELHRALASRVDAPWLILWWRWAETWSLLANGRWEDAIREATELEGAAGREGEPALVVEAAAQRALALTSLGTLQEALRQARRASRMARTEGLPQQEYLAHLVLARCRRLTGHPHLATRILGALARVASPVWRPWIRWELVMSGALEVAADLSSPLRASRAAAASDALVGLHLAAERGDRARFEAALQGLARVPLFAPLCPELDTLVAACDVRRPAHDAALIAWSSGLTVETPPFLHGVITRDGCAPSGDSTIAYVLSRPDVGRRRIPRLAWGLASLDGVRVLNQTRRRKGRVETLVASALLAGAAGLDEAEGFTAVYGFRYDPPLHKGVLDVLVHRARAYLEGAGRLERAAGRLVVAEDAPLIVPDPRCTKAAPDRVLHTLAQQQGATAQDVAAALGVSLRAAQALLRELTESGACVSQKDGRVQRYFIEDTTFSEPTRS